MKAITCMNWMRKGGKEWTPRMSEPEVLQKPLAADAATEDEEDEEMKRIVKDYNLDDYSDDDDDEQQGSTNKFTHSDLAFYNKNQKDPYLNSSDDDEDEEDMKILADDNLIIVGKADREVYTLEMWVYNEKKESLYCHHDYILPSCALAVEVVKGMPQENVVAVAGFDANIDFWDLSLVNCLDPLMTLQGYSSGKEKKMKKKKKKEGKNDVPKGHTDAVLGLSWNHLQPHLLASCSADARVAVWDVTSRSCAFVGEKRPDKVQDIEWHNHEAHTILIGCADHTVQVLDCRSPSQSVKSWTLSAEVEKVLWHTRRPFCFFSGLSNGHICYIDIRSDVVVRDVKAHDGGVTDMTLLRGCGAGKDGPAAEAGESSDAYSLVSGCEDGYMKVWCIDGLTYSGMRGDIDGDMSGRSASGEMSNGESGNHKADEVGKGGMVRVLNKKMKGDKIFCLAACPDSFNEQLVALGTETEVKVVNLSKLGEPLTLFRKGVDDDNDDKDDNGDNDVSSGGEDDDEDEGDEEEEKAVGKNESVNEYKGEKKKMNVKIKKVKQNVEVEIIKMKRKKNKIEKEEVDEDGDDKEEEKMEVLPKKKKKKKKLQNSELKTTSKQKKRNREVTMRL